MDGTKYKTKTQLVLNWNIHKPEGRGMHTTKDSTATSEDLYLAEV